MAQHQLAHHLHQHIPPTSKVQSGPAGADADHGAFSVAGAQQAVPHLPARKLGGGGKEEGEGRGERSSMMGDHALAFEKKGVSVSAAGSNIFEL